MHAPDDGPLRLLSGWGNRPASAAVVRAPRHADDIVDTLSHPGTRGVIPRGLGRSYGDAAQNAGGVVLDMTALSELRELDLEAGTVTACAGTSLDTLMRALLPLGWFIPVTPGTRHVTVGGAIAADIHGKNHHHDGSFCDHVEALQLLTPEGGLRHITPKEDSDAFTGTAGGMGLTGIVLEATLRLLPVSTSRVRVDTDRAENLDEAMALMESGDAGYRYSVAWIDCLARGRRLGRSVLMRGDHAEADEIPSAQRGDALAYRTRSLGQAPAWMPGLVNRIGVRAFNELWFRRAPRSERGALRSIPSFFHPLDAIENWNRLYGKGGFVQYQFVVPLGEEDVLRRVLERVSATGYPSFLAVLKQFGPGHGMLSFPALGWTLALDMPARLSGLGPFLDSLDDLVAAAGGRVYLAKDSRMRPEALEAMYPELDRWREIRSRLDPHGVLRSDLDRRLGLSAPVRRS